MKARRCGLILLNKPEGVTSFRVLDPVKRAVGHRKIGHTGTLDKFASGLLPLLAGSYTKLNSFFTGLDKRYTGTIRFGRSTDTLDPEGAITEEAELPEFSAVEGVLEGFRGVISQVPPAYSALHVGGKRAYRRALDGEEVDLPARPVQVYHLEVLSWEPPDLTLTIHCSKGTYVRSLARDIGRAAGSVAHLVRLRRDAVGAYTLEESVTPDEFDPERDMYDSAQTIARLPGIGLLSAEEETAALIGRGKPPKSHWFPSAPEENGSYAVEDSRGRLLALIRRDGKGWGYHFVVDRGQT